MLVLSHTGTNLVISNTSAVTYSGETGANLLVFESGDWVRLCKEPDPDPDPDENAEEEDVEGVSMFSGRGD